MLSELRRFLKRHRRLAILLSAVFVLFEISRVVAVGELLLPDWLDQAGVIVNRMLNRPPWIAAITFTVAALLFAIPMTLAVLLVLKIRRALSHYWTRVNRPS